MKTWHISWCAPPTGGAGVAVAVLDTRVALHADIPPIAPEDYRIFAGGDDDPAGHGTAAAGIVASLAPRCRLIVAQVIPPGLQAADEALHDGLRWAVDRGAQIVVLGVGRRRAWGAPFDAAWEARAASIPDVLLVAPAGNGSAPGRPEAVRDPAAAPSVLAVGAIDPDGRPLSVNAADDGVAGIDVLAPGVGVWAPHPDGRNTPHTGTSTAAAVVAGWAAALRAGDPGLDAAALRARLSRLSAVHSARGRSCR